MTPIFSTAATYLTQIRAETRVGSSPTSTALQDTALLRQLHDANEWFTNFPYTIGMLGWKFNQREQIISTIANTTLTFGLSSGDNAVILASGTGWDSPSSDVGGGFVKHSTNILDFFTFGSRSSGTLSTVAGIQMSHPIASEVHKVYRLNSDFGKPRALFRESNVLEYQYLDQDMRQSPPYGFYMIKTLYGTSYNGDFMVFPLSVGSVNWKFYYLKKPSTISLSTNTMDVPDGTGRRAVIEQVNAYVWTVLGEFGLAREAEQRALQMMEKCLSEWATHTAQATQNLTLSW